MTAYSVNVEKKVRVVQYVLDLFSVDFCVLCQLFIAFLYITKIMFWLLIADSSSSSVFSATSHGGLTHSYASGRTNTVGEAGVS